MGRPNEGRERLVVYVLAGTAERLRSDAGDRPLGYAVDDLCGGQPVVAREVKPDAVPVKAVAKVLPRVAVKRDDEAAELERLMKPQFRGKGRL